MRTFPGNAEQQRRFLTALSETGNPAAAALRADLDPLLLQKLRERDRDFQDQWDEAKRLFADALTREGLRRAINGTPEPVVSDGKVVRDDEGQPISVQRYSDSLLHAYLKAEFPEKFRDGKRTVVLLLPPSVQCLAVLLVVGIMIWLFGDLALRLASLK